MTCELCHGLRGHERIKDAMNTEFESEHTQAKLECERLEALFKEVCWYNFETKCRTWVHPWPESWGGSSIELHGVRITVDNSRGRAREIGEFPVYYHGSVADAPELPPQILLVELKSAYEDVRRAFENCTAPYDWAPGGRLYNQLLLTTSVPTDHDRRLKRARDAADVISKRVLDGDGRGDAN
jgi:hypothetical protein